MKKNVMMRVAALLMVCVLATTCGISGTFAKYTSTFEGTATANVANWKFEMNGVSLENTFTFDLNATVKEIGGGEEEHVKQGVIAPGTQGQFTIVLENLSDVTASYNVTVTPDGDIPPVEFTVNNGTGNMIYGTGTATITVDWVWEWTETDETQYAGEDLTATVTIVLNQVN